ncbi:MULTISPECIES: response regulator transcription factor [Gracilibacillus]|uniref:DNA-binding response regulator n=1 Tax=Gracilibacillus dipsosauri TaxID=178340 RepID=A0A317KX04_9BACI|nr:response regulator transcription factor [Gracilibacillus dipsosauri]PWU67240.1 DNA-binding response regulator [Gracilibacillus dipsosauri]
MYKILLIGSNKHSTEAFRHMVDWNQLGFCLTVCLETPNSVMELFNKDRFSFIIINMTDLKDKGLQLCEALRKISSIPILLIGGNKDFQIIRKALNLQVNDYIPDPVNPTELKSSLLLIKETLSSAHYKSNTLLHLAKPISNQTSDIIEKVKNYVNRSLNESLSKKITLKEIADQLNYNCSYLSHKFKCRENMTFNEFLLKQRMEKAKLLLEKTDMKIYEVAQEVGYVELDWFYKKFKTYTGVNANKYRQLAGSK